MPWCPVERTVETYKMLDRESLVKLVRMNWRMVVLEIVASSGGPMTYGGIARISGLSSRTVSKILKELTAERLLERKPVPGRGARKSYSATIIGMRISTMQCQILRFASDKMEKKAH